MLDAFLVRDAKEPASEPVIVAQSADVTDGSDESFLDDVQTRRFAADQFENVRIQRQFVTLEQSVPRLRLPHPGYGHRQLFGFSHCQHLHWEECAKREKVQSDV
jgi:hypothetical protein